MSGAEFSPYCIGMEELLRANLLHLSSLFSGATGLSLTRISRRMLHDSSFFRRIADGDGFNVKTYDRAVAWFDAHWPQQVIWPEDIERKPAVQEAA